MLQIREWAVKLCVAFIASTFLCFIVPEGRLKKTANNVITLFLLSVIFIPIVDDSIFNAEFSDFEVSYLPEEDDYFADYNSFLIDNSKKLIEDEVKGLLSGICNSKYDVKAEIDLTDDGNIMVKKVLIRITESDMANYKKIISAVSQYNGIDAEIELMD